MATLLRVRSSWGGTGVVGAGVSTFYFVAATPGVTAAVSTLWSSMAPVIATGVSITTLNTGDTIDSDTGEINGSYTDGTTTTVTSSGTGSYASGVGARIRWTTGGIRAGRRVRGATFICPLSAANYDTNGTIASGVVTSMSAAAQALLTATTPNFVIYSRPGGGLPGQASVVTAGIVPDAISWLRSRRV